MDYFFLGLGNPSGHEGTRHNVGKDFVSGLVRQSQCSWTAISNGRIATVLLGGHLITCCVSDGYMNTTGEDLSAALRELKPAHLVVVHDEVDLPVGVVRLSKGKNAAGHHGVESIIQAVGTKDFFRLRIGVGRETDVSKRVLEQIPPGELEKIAHCMHQSLPDILSDLFTQQSSADISMKPTQG